MVQIENVAGFGALIASNYLLQQFGPKLLKMLPVPGPFKDAILAASTAMADNTIYEMFVTPPGFSSLTITNL